MRTRLGFAAFALWMLSTPAPAGGHHSASAEFDAAKRIKITGALTKLNWLNPHIIFFIDVTGDGGKVAQLELGVAEPEPADAGRLDAELNEDWGHGHRRRDSRPRRQQSRDGDDRDAGQYGKAAVRRKSRRTVAATHIYSGR